jgi:hypothetical protein
MNGRTVGDLREQLHMGTCPGSGANGYTPVLRAERDKIVRGYFIGSSLLGVMLHWDERCMRLLPCRKDRSDCPYCLRGRPSQWKGYCAAAVWPSRARRVVEIPEGAYRACRELLAKEGHLRGLWFELRRFPGPSNNAPVQVRLAEGAPIAQIEDEWDILKSLLIFWGLSEEKRRALDTATLAQRLDDHGLEP